MKISEFAALHHVSPDTVRYYIKEGLLYPIRDGYHFSFDAQCSNDLRRILSLKDAGFSLADIRQIMLAGQGGLLSASVGASGCQELYRRRLEEITAELDRLTHAKHFVESFIEPEKTGEPAALRPFGVPLSALSWLVCPHCRGPLTLESNQIEANQIINGSFSCPQCRTSWKVENGIFMVSPNPDAYKNFSSFDLFLDQSNQALMQAIAQNVRWLKSCINKYRRPVRTCLDAGSGFGFFLRHTYDLIPDHCLYFAMDHDPMRHQFLRNALASRPEVKNVVLLCCRYEDIPLRAGSIDQIIDYGGSNDYSWTTPGFLLDLLDWLTHEHSSVLYLNRSYDKIPFDSPIDVACRGYLYEDAILKDLKKLGYSIREKLRMDFTQRLKATNAFMDDKDQIYRLWIYLEKHP